MPDKPIIVKGVDVTSQGHAYDVEVESEEEAAIDEDRGWRIIEALDGYGDD